MATDPNKTVFISYRRSVSKHFARLIFNHLREHDYDVFMDVESIDSGQFDKVILNQISARTHFIVLLSKGSLKRCQNTDDWLRQEIEEALTLGRNVVPILDEGFNFKRETNYLPEQWREKFRSINSLPWSHFHFESSARYLRERFLQLPEFPVILTPVSIDEQREVEQRLEKVNQEIHDDVSVENLLKPIPETPNTIVTEVSDSPTIQYTDNQLSFNESLSSLGMPKQVFQDLVTDLNQAISSAVSADIPDLFHPTEHHITPKIETPPRKIITPYTTSLKIMPKPFEWITIPAGKVTIESYLGYLGYFKESTTFDVPAFQIAKYPTTNAQFDVFINHPDGYKDPAWWDFSEDARKWRMENTKPRYKNLSGDDYPCHNVSWYESVAFCLWLSAITGEKIMLSTEQQWQRAAQGDDEWKYPWGNRWDKKRCNNSVKNLLGMGDSKSTTPVTQYEGKGDSPYGVVDMVGNVWEWCSTDWTKGDSDLNGINERVVRGGSWVDADAARFRVSFRNWLTPKGRDDFGGFRFVRF